MDLTTYADEELDSLRLAVLTERERRTKIAGIPDQIASLRDEYLAAGGDPADLDKTAEEA